MAPLFSPIQQLFHLPPPSKAPRSSACCTIAAEPHGLSLVAANAMATVDPDFGPWRNTTSPGHFTCRVFRWLSVHHSTSWQCFASHVSNKPRVCLSQKLLRTLMKIPIYGNINGGANTNSVCLCMTTRRYRHSPSHN